MLNSVFIEYENGEQKFSASADLDLVMLDNGDYRLTDNKGIDEILDAYSLRKLIRNGQVLILNI